MHTEEVQLHIWPWSVGNHNETIPLWDDAASVPYYGSPVLSVPAGCTLFTDIRYEELIPLGCPYEYGKYTLHQLPHAIAALRYGSSNTINVLPLSFRLGGERHKIRLRPDGAVQGSLQDHSPLQEVVKEWIAFFDMCVELHTDKSARQVSTPWREILTLINNFQHDAVQRRSLIIKIAEDMHQRIQEIVHTARRILAHERTLLPAARAEELDSACLHWYFRQPGISAAQKASANQQRLLAVSRREVFNTLENRVLKDFLIRCQQECRQYLRLVNDNDNSTGYGKLVTTFGRTCGALVRQSQFAEVEPPESGMRPNYVLQSDVRYKKIWQLYKKLLRKQDEEDWTWAWQGRTWADIVTLLISATIIRWAERQPSGTLNITPLARSSFAVRTEQVQGSRLLPGTEPGPFLLRNRNYSAVMELVPAAKLGDHDVLNKMLGRTGGSLYLLLKPLSNVQRPPKVVIIWPIHTLAATQLPDFRQIADSAERAVLKHDTCINDRRQLMEATGFVVADAFASGKPDFDAGTRIHLARLAARPTCWPQNMDILELLLSDLFSQLLEQN